MSSPDAALQAQAQAMAEKALAALPPDARAAKLDKVKEGILKRLRAQANGAAPTPPPATQSARAPLPDGGSASPAPPPPPDATLKPVEKLQGVEMCGDEMWFANSTFRRQLQEKVAVAHAEQKILVGPPSEEIRRICPGGGRILGAGAVLRLGGSMLGGYGDGDVAYAYRQLSRALHPDKNPGVPEAANAFRRLSEAADELRLGLADARGVLKSLCEATGGRLTAVLMERPQEALVAEASRLFFGVVGLTGEGEVPSEARDRAIAYFSASQAFNGCEAQVLSTMWYESPHLLDSLARAPMRAAYDCAPKRLRAQFVCALSRVAVAEARRFDGLRGNWQPLLTQYPELGLWRELRERIVARIAPKVSKWEDRKSVV